MMCRIIPISWNFARDHSMACRKIPLSWVFLPCSLSTAGQGACNGFEAQWNFSGTSTWAIDPDSFEQVGCIYTSQGLEFDYCGVIIGLDLRYEGGKVITDPTKNAKSDKSTFSPQSLKKGPSPLGDMIIKNTYKTLLTRGQKGCFIFCEDQNLADYLVKLGAKKV